MNQGLPSDRLEVDWWVNSRRVVHRLSKHPRRQLRLDDFELADALIIHSLSTLPAISDITNPFILIEIPVDFPTIKKTDPAQALKWRIYIRDIFEELFSLGFLITDFIHDTKSQTSRSFYVFCQGEATL